MGMFDDLMEPGAAPASAPVRFDPAGEPNQFERLLAKITIPESAQWGLNRARGFAMGAADPVVGAVQLAANIGNIGGIGDSVLHWRHFHL